MNLKVLALKIQVGRYYGGLEELGTEKYNYTTSPLKKKKKKVGLF